MVRYVVTFRSSQFDQEKQVWPETSVCVAAVDPAEALAFARVRCLPVHVSPWWIGDLPAYTPVGMRRLEDDECPCCAETVDENARRLRVRSDGVCPMCGRVEEQREREWRRRHRMPE